MADGVKCPHCDKEISAEEIAKALGSKGGKRSRRKLSSEQGRAMVGKRWKKRKE